MKKDTLLNISNLAKIDIPDSDIDELTQNLNNILKLISEIDAAPTEEMDPMAHPLDFNQPLRDDKADKNIDRDSIQTDKSKIKDGYYIVPKIID